MSRTEAPGEGGLPVASSSGLCEQVKCKIGLVHAKSASEQRFFSFRLFGETRSNDASKPASEARPQLVRAPGAHQVTSMVCCSLEL